MKPPDRSPNRPLVLIVDDCVEQRDLYEMALDPDFEIVTAGRGADAIALAASRLPDAIVLDVLMPGMNGLEVCRHLKRDSLTADIPVIMLTGADPIDVPADAVLAGAAAVLTKPCSLPRLIGTVRAAIGRSGAVFRRR